MTEGAPRPSLPTHETVSFLQTPVLADVLFRDDSTRHSQVNVLLRQGVPLELRRLVRTPDDVQQHVSGLARQFGDLRHTIISAVVKDYDPLALRPRIDPDAAAALEQTRDDAVTIVIPANHPVTKHTHKAMTELNEGLDDVRRDHAFNRLLRDRPAKETEAVLKVGAVAVGAGLAAGGLNTLGLEGPALTIAGQTDDVLGAAALAKTERGGEKSWGQIVKENKLVAGAVGTAAAVDLVLPQLLVSDKWYISAPAGAMYAFTATAGSIAAAYENYSRAKTVIKELDHDRTEGDHLSNKQVRELARTETFSHPYRKWLVAGVAASLAASVAAEEMGILEGDGFISGLTAGSIGPIETVTALTGAALDNRISEWVHGLRDHTS